jgi:putative membrane protein
VNHRRGPGNELWHEGARHADDTWWGGPLHFLVLLLLVGLLVVGVVWLVRRLAPAAAAPAPAPAAAQPVAPSLTPASDPAVSALRMRYAKGEVSREEFQRTMDDLSGATAATAAWPGSAPADEPPPPAN